MILFLRLVHPPSLYIQCIHVHTISTFNTPLNLCSVCGGLGLACLGEIHVWHAFRGCVKSDNTLDSRITTLEPAVLASLYLENLMCYPTLIHFSAMDDEVVTL